MCQLTIRHHIGRHCHGPATPLIAARSTTSDDLTSSSRHLAAFRQRLRSVITGTSPTQRRSSSPTKDRNLVGPVNANVFSRYRNVCLANVEFKSGQRELLLAATRDLSITIRLVLADIDRCTTELCLQAIQVLLLLIIQSWPKRTGMSLVSALLYFSLSTHFTSLKSFSHQSVKKGGKIILMLLASFLNKSYVLYCVLYSTVAVCQLF